MKELYRNLYVNNKKKLFLSLMLRFTSQINTKQHTSTLYIVGNEIGTRVNLPDDILQIKPTHFC